MISPYAMQSSAASHQYHSDAFDLARDTGEGIANESIYATWGGKGAEYAGLGVGSRITSDAFLAALNGDFINPATQQVQHVGGFRKAPESGQSVWKHPPGLELVFSGPKSFSMMALTGGDDRLKTALSLAVDRTMGYAERHLSMSKVSVDGAKHDKLTGNLLWGKFPHETSRHNDEQLHYHLPVLNGSYDTESKQWRGLNNHKLLGAVNDLRLDQIFMAELRGIVESMGYKTVDSEHSAKFGGWELDGFSRELVQEASRSKQAADAHMRANGQDYETAGRLERQFAHYDSRPDKSRIARAELMANWRSRTDRHGLDLDAMRTQAIERSHQQDGRVATVVAREALIAALAETQGKVVLPEQVIADTMTRAAGKASLQDVQRAYHDALTSGALHSLAHNGMVSTSERAAATITRSALPEHVTAAMRKTGERLAKKHGIEAPRSDDPTEWRTFLNAHSDKRLGEPTARPSARQLQNEASIDAKLDKVLAELRDTVAAGKEAKADLTEYLRQGGSANSAQANAFQAKVDAGQDAAQQHTPGQLAEKVQARHPDLDKGSALRAIARAAEKGDLHKTEFAKADGQGVYAKFSLEASASRIDLAQAAMGKERSSAEADYFKSALARNMSRLEGEAVDKHMGAARVEAHAAASKYGSDGTKAYHAEFERVMAKAESKVPELGKDAVASAVLSADRATAAWQARGGAAAETDRESLRDSLRAANRTQQQADRMAKTTALTTARAARRTTLNNNAANAVDPKTWAKVREVDANAYKAELASARKDFEAGWAARMAQAQDTSGLKAKLQPAQDRFDARQQADRNRWEAQGRPNPQAFEAKQARELGAHRAEQGNVIGKWQDHQAGKLQTLTTAYKEAKATFDQREKQGVDRWQDGRARQQQKWERARENRWKLPSMAIKTRNGRIRDVALNIDRGLGRGMLRAEFSLRTLVGLALNNASLVKYKRAGLIYSSAVRLNRVTVAAREKLQVGRRVGSYLKSDWRQTKRELSSVGRWAGKVALNGIQSAAAKLSHTRQYEKAASILGVSGVPKAQDLAKAKALGHATKSIKQSGGEHLAKADRMTPVTGEKGGQDFVTGMFGAKDGAKKHSQTRNIQSTRNTRTAEQNTAKSAAKARGDTRRPGASR